MKSYKHDIGAYRRDTASLTMAQDGAYRRMLDELYATEKPLPGSKTEIYRICRAFEQWERNAVDRVLTLFFNLTDCGYMQKRAGVEIARGSKADEAHRQSGLGGGRPRKPNRFQFGFVAPSFLEVLSYMRELKIQNLEQEAEKFVNYHEQRKWRLNHGKGAVMSDWKRAVVTWKHNIQEFGRANGKRDTRSEAHVGQGPEVDGPRKPLNPCAVCGWDESIHRKHEAVRRLHWPASLGHGFVAQASQVTA